MDGRGVIRLVEGLLMELASERTDNSRYPVLHTVA